MAGVLLSILAALSDHAIVAHAKKHLAWLELRQRQCDEHEVPVFPRLLHIGMDEAVVRDGCLPIAGCLV